MIENLSDGEKLILLRLAREALEISVKGQNLPQVDDDKLTPLLLVEGASFVTLTENGQLRGCIGTLQPYQALYQDVREHAMAAALEDRRFSPVRPSELVHIHIEVSRLTMPQTLIYQNTEDLLEKLRPGIDGVILRDGHQRATFLPQVWSQIPSKEEFLSHLCMKMGSTSNRWRQKQIDIQIYQVEEFHE